MYLLRFQYNIPTKYQYKRSAKLSITRDSCPQKETAGAAFSTIAAPREAIGTRFKRLHALSLSSVESYVASQRGHLDSLPR
jgi:hypothetical protein